MTVSRMTRQSVTGVERTTRLNGARCRRLTSTGVKLQPRQTEQSTGRLTDGTALWPMGESRRR